MSDEVVGGQAPAEGGNSAPVAPAPTTPSAAAPPVTQSQAQPQEDRTNWLPPYRVREMREAAVRDAQQRYQQEMGSVKSELDRYRAQIQALVGATPQQTTEADQIKQQLYKVVPFLQKLEERYGDLEGLIDTGQDMKTQVDHYWSNYGVQTMDRLFKMAEESYGGPLNNDGKAQLHASFIGFLQADPSREARYGQDPSIVNDFWKQFNSAFVEPIRRTTSAGVVNRAGAVARLPQDTPSGVLPQSGAPKLSGLDERAAAAWADYQARTKA